MFFEKAQGFQQKRHPFAPRYNVVIFVFNSP